MDGVKSKEDQSRPALIYFDIGDFERTEEAAIYGFGLQKKEWLLLISAMVSDGAA